MSHVDDAIEALSRAGVVLVVDDEDRENEGDLIMAAEYADTDSVAYFLEHTSGFLCVAIDEERAAELDLGLMVPENTEKQGTAFLVSVDYLPGTTTGISAGDRAATIRALADPALDPADLARPGHIMPLLARPGGVLERPGHTEAGVDLCRMAGLSGAALLCEIVTPDRRSMLRGDGLADFARRHRIPIVTIDELRAYRSAARPVVTRTGQSMLPTEAGTFEAIAYRSPGEGVEHMALVMGDVTSGSPLVRLHSECITGDIAGSLRCDCGTQLRAAMAAISEAGAGVLVYLRGHEGRGIGLGDKLRAYQLQMHEGLDTVDANVSLGLPVDGRDYGAACDILVDLGVRRVRLLTNNPDKVRAVEAAGLSVERAAHEFHANHHNVRYLEAKRDRLGHELHQLA
ncbi:GTP cyclohydrolase II [Pseudonocardia sp. C8]|uniref:GTP cyclohydrolase II n=1 Tax=Pseudonocardia sp. C8 TaxID=2762759 RepID=UPI001642F089|nr:GTP cyclohydrolase II [Pseudonocardia sp. C8]MBC3190391.1 GTP cyclohydrolase II [Pseudonocardia sp. C8]